MGADGDLPLADVVGLVGAEGRRVHVTAFGTGSPVVVLHGGGPGCHAVADWWPVVAHLPGRKLLVDLPQFGAADPAVVDGPGWSTQASTLLAAIDALGLARVDVVAQSYGGGVALALAVDHPDRVGRIALIGSQPSASGPETPGASTGRRAREELYGSDGPTLEGTRALMARYEWHDASRVPERTVELRFAAASSPAALAAALDPNARGAPQDLGDRLADVAAPVLVLWGEHDPFGAPTYAEWLAAELPRGTCQVVEAASHHCQSERPDVVGAAITAFLDRTNQEQP